MAARVEPVRKTEKVRADPRQVVLVEDADTGNAIEAKSAAASRYGSADPAVSFLCPSHLDAVRFRQLFQRFSESVHAGLVIVKLL